MRRSPTGSATPSGGRAKTSPPPRSRPRYPPTRRSRRQRCSASRCPAPAAGQAWWPSNSRRARSSTARRWPRPPTNDCPATPCRWSPRTPDSFYDRGATFTDEAAKAAAHRVIEDGADVVDVGGVKAGPGDSVGVDEEIARVVPFIEWLRGTFPDQLISVDTWRSEVGKQACAAGAGIINDTWGGHDPALPEGPAEFGAGLGCPHTGGG